MTKRFLLAMGMLWVCTSSLAENSCEMAANMMKILHFAHYKAPNLTVENETHVALSLINAFDPNRIYFLESDIDELLNHTKGLLDTSNNSSCEFVQLFADRYKKGKSTARASLDKIVASIGSSNDVLASLKAYKEGREGFTKTEAELTKRQRSYYQFIVNDLYVSKYAKFDEGTGKEQTKLIDFKTQISTEIEAKRNCAKTQEDYVEAISNELLNCLALEFDPHSAFFPPQDLNAFKVGLSKESESFGLAFTQEENQPFEVAKIFPGSTAWQSGSVYVGDQLLGVFDAANKELELFCLKAHELAEFLDFGENKILTFRLKHSDGAVEDIKLSRSKIEVDENVIRGLVLEGEQKFGYIALPSFYTNWDDYNGLGCANDLAREILNLKQDGIKGLILDLRNNGGGSMSEALQMAGIFINEGTLIITDARGDKPRLQKDPNRGLVYSDPLIVLVNQFSASASEILAGILQDYNRALIVGSTTYGKSTSQRILPVLLPGSNLEGSVKVTTGAMYRIDGTSYQAKGIVPDVELVSLYNGLGYKEANEYNAIRLEKIEKNTYAFPLPALPVDKLNEQSKARVAANPIFKEYSNIEPEISSIINNQIIKVDVASIYAQNQKIEHLFDAAEAAEKESESYKVKEHSNAAVLSQLSEVAAETYVEIKSDVLKDPYIQECYNILKDWIIFVNE